MASSSSASSYESDSDSDSDDATSPQVDLNMYYLKELAKKHATSPEDHKNFTNYLATMPIGLKRAKKRSLDRHRKPKQPKTMWLCVGCDETFESKELIKEHQLKCEVTTQSPPKKAFKCNQCDKSYVRIYSLRNHVEKKHANVNARKEPEKYRCCLCRDVRINIYGHYMGKHTVEYVEQLLFKNGRVLVISDIDTGDGTAPWFREQLEKAKAQFKTTACVLCAGNVVFDDVALLNTHYVDQHKVDADYLDVIQLMFRVELGSHLVKNTKPKIDKKKNKPPVSACNTRYIFKCKCGKAVDNYDEAIEHSQEHLLAQYDGKSLDNDNAIEIEVDPIGDNIKEIYYDFETLLTDAWFDRFDSVLSDKETIISSSIYCYSRSIKLHKKDDSTGLVPAFKCDMCQLFVDPLKIENHCKNYDTCIKSKPKGFCCEECNVNFYSAKALAYHKEHHAAGFRLVMFNRKDDEHVNKVLSGLQNHSDDSQTEVDVENPKKRGEVRNVEVREVKQLCNQCQKWMPASVFEAHAAEHENGNSRIASQQNEANTDNATENISEVRKETDQPQDKQAGITTKDKNISDSSTKSVDNYRETAGTELIQNKRANVTEDVAVTDENDKDEDAVELWDSDDSCSGFQSISVQADINVSVHNLDDVQSGSSVVQAESEDCRLESGDEELPNTEELEQMFGSDSEMDRRDNASFNGEQSTLELNLEVGAGNETQAPMDCEGMTDGNTETAQPDINGNVEREGSNEQENVRGATKRMSARDIINELLPDDEELDQDEFLKLNELVTMNLSSRD